MFFQSRLKGYLSRFSKYLIFQSRECGDLSLKEELLALASRQRRVIELIQDAEKTKFRIQHLTNDVVQDAHIGETE